MPKEKNTVNATAKSFNSKTKIDKNVNIYDLSYDESPKTEFTCTACGHVYKKREGNFCKSTSPIYAKNDTYVHICKKCTVRLYYNWVDFFSGNEEKAMDRMCQIFDWYYSDEIFASTSKISANYSRVTAYPSKSNLPQYNSKDKTYADTIKDRASKSINTVEELEEAKESKDFKIAKKTTSFFGLGYTQEQYKFLQDQYDDWTHRHEAKTKAQEELFKNLCIAQLNIQIAQATPNGKVKEAMDTFQNLLGSANLKPNQTNENAISDQNTFGTLIKKWENERPIPEPNPEWKDVDGIVKYITVYFLGHLCKMLNVKNSYARMYDEEMNKYRVSKPEYEGDDEALFDVVFGGAKHTNDE